MLHVCYLVSCQYHCSVPCLSGFKAAMVQYRVHVCCCFCVFHWTNKVTVWLNRREQIHLHGTKTYRHLQRIKMPRLTSFKDRLNLVKELKSRILLFQIGATRRTRKILTVIVRSYIPCCTYARQVCVLRLPICYGSFQPPRPTQPSIPPGSVNEIQLRLGRQRQVWFIPLADERGVCR